MSTDTDENQPRRLGDLAWYGSLENGGEEGLYLPQDTAGDTARFDGENRGARVSHGYLLRLRGRHDDRQVDGGAHWAQARGLRSKVEVGNGIGGAKNKGRFHFDVYSIRVERGRFRDDRRYRWQARRGGAQHRGRSRGT